MIWLLTLSLSPFPALGVEHAVTICWNEFVRPVEKFFESFFLSLLCAIAAIQFVRRVFFIAWVLHSWSQVVARAKYMRVTECLCEQVKCRTRAHTTHPVCRYRKSANIFHRFTHKYKLENTTARKCRKVKRNRFTHRRRHCIVCSALPVAPCPSSPSPYSERIGVCS